MRAGPQSGQRFALVASTVLGRGQFADLVIADLAVSRRHAQIEPEGVAFIGEEFSVKAQLDKLTPFSKQIEDFRTDNVSKQIEEK